MSGRFSECFRHEHPARGAAFPAIVHRNSHAQSHLSVFSRGIVIAVLADDMRRTLSPSVQQMPREIDERYFEPHPIGI
jgi:hypothetical protein